MQKKSIKGQTLDVKFPGISKQRISKYVSTFTKQEQEVFYKRFGKNLDQFNYGLNSEENNMMVTLYGRIEKFFDKIEKYRNYFADNDLNTENIKNDIDLLSDNAREEIIKVYGENLDEFNEEKVDLRHISNALSEIENRRYLFDDFENDFSKTIEYFKEYPVDMIKRAICDIKTKYVNEVLIVEKSKYKKIEDLSPNILAIISNRLGVIRVLDIYKEFNCSKEYIDTFIDKLDALDKMIIKKTIDREKITKSEYARYKKIVRKIKNQIKSEKQIETIYNLYSKYTKNEVDDAISRLSEYDRKKIILRYGENLYNPQRSPEYTKEDSEYFIRVILPKLDRMLKDKNYSEKNKISVKVLVPIGKKVAETNVVAENKPEKKKNKTLIEMFSDIDVEDLKILVSILPKNFKNVIYLKHTKELNDYVYFNHNDKNKYTSIYDEAIMKLDEAADIYKKGIEQICNIDRESIIAKLNEMDDESLIVIKKIHGEDYNKTLPLCMLTDKEKEIYNNVISQFNIVIEKKEPVVEENPIKQKFLEQYSELYDYFLTEEELENIIDISMVMYKDELDIEKNIIRELYAHLKRLIKDNNIRVRKSQ